MAGEARNWATRGTTDSGERERGLADESNRLSARALSAEKRQRVDYCWRSLVVRNVGDSVGESISCVGLHSRHPSGCPKLTRLREDVNKSAIPANK